MRGSVGWLGLALYVALWDAAAAPKVGKTETLSSAFWDAVLHPKHRRWVIPSWIFISLHLFHGLPKKYDPLRRLAEHVVAAELIEDMIGAS